ncbi:MAG TPA: peptide ABC transporter [Acidimicrobiaceae bacterium]|nr:peptide ABC transporter [Acidimicrobiaceae bacterium]HCB37711.1 peptide ABC transporter [Acidimicrobiaceae bacterium]
MIQRVRDNVAPLAVGAGVAAVAWAWVARPPLSWTFGVLMAVGVGAAAITDGRYVLRRVAAVVPVLLAVSFLIFALMASLPGDPAINILGPAATPDAVKFVNEELGLDQPFFNRYGNWLGDVVAGDLGSSVLLRESIADGMSRSMTPTLQLMAYSLVISLTVAVPVGIYSAYRVGGRFDRSSNYLMLGFLAMPNFVFAVLLVLFLAIGGVSVAGTTVGGDWLPATRYVPLGENVVLHFKHLALPSIALALGQSAVLMRLLRSDMIATLRLPFIDLARSKGLTDNRILWRHALRPSSFTSLTVMGLLVGALIGGALIIEFIFVLPGVGSYVFLGVSQRDFIAVQGGVLVISTLFIAVLTMTDFLYLALDPRLRTAAAGD